MRNPHIPAKSSPVGGKVGNVATSAKHGLLPLALVCVDKPSMLLRPTLRERDVRNLVPTSVKLPFRF